MANTLLFDLREAAKYCTSQEWRTAAINAADRLQSAISDLSQSATEENMKTLNGAWARAQRIFKMMPPMQSPIDPKSEALAA